MRKRTFPVPKYFSFNCGPRWSIVAHYNGYGLGIRDEYSHFRIMLLFWHMIIDKKQKGSQKAHSAN